MWGERDEKQSVQTVHAAIDAGINFFDTAEKYGDGLSEEILGKALSGKRRRAVVATKVAQTNLSRVKLMKACECSLIRLRTDYIDLYQIHWPSSEGVSLAETCAALNTLRDQGKIRFCSVCNFGVNDLTELSNYGSFETNQIPYSLLWRAIEYGTIQKTRELGYGIIVYSTLMHGLLSGKYGSADEVPEERIVSRHFHKGRPGIKHGQNGFEALTFRTIAQIRSIGRAAGLSLPELALAWVLHQEGVTSVLAGVTHPDQASQNARIAEIRISSDILANLSSVTDELKQALGPDADIWQYPGRIK